MIHAQVTRNDDNSLHLIRIEVTEESLKNFEALINRALNCWDSAPSELKELGDMFTHGRVTQDHKIQPINTKQNTDYYSSRDLSIIRKYIDTYGTDAWARRVSEGTIGEVLKQTAKD